MRGEQPCRWGAGGLLCLQNHVTGKQQSHGPESPGDREGITALGRLQEAASPTCLHTAHPLGRKQSLTRSGVHTGNTPRAPFPVQLEVPWL